MQRFVLCLSKGGKCVTVISKLIIEWDGIGSYWLACCRFMFNPTYVMWCDVMWCVCAVRLKKKKKKNVFFGHVCSTHCSLRSSILFGDSLFIFIFLRNRIACLLFMANLAYQKKKLWPTCNCCNIKINVSSYKKI